MGVWGSESGGSGPVKDDSFIIQDADDETKKAVFDVENITPGNTRTVKVPDHDVDLPVILSGTGDPPDPAGLPVGTIFFKHE